MAGAYAIARRHRLGSRSVLALVRSIGPFSCRARQSGAIQEEDPMTSRMVILVAAALAPLTLSTSFAPARAEGSGQRQVFENGLVRVKSAYSFAQTIERLKGDVAVKGITFFFAVE